MIRAKSMLEKAKAHLNEHTSSKRTLKPINREIKSNSPVRVQTPPPTYSQDSPPSGKRRFGCDICNHFFGKKFNLDRHNRTLHDRDTPDDFPTSPKADVVEAKARVVTPKKIITSPKKSLVKKSPVLKTEVIESADDKIMVACKVCKKKFKKSSLARHAIIHTGNKTHECTTCSKAFYQKSDMIRHLVSFFFASTICEVKRKYFVSKTFKDKVKR